MADLQQVAGESVDCLSVGILVADHLCDPIDRLPDPGELVLSPRLPLSIGGCAANVAIDLARLGVRAGVVGCVGDDAFGRFVIDTLAAADVDVHGIRALPETETSGTLIINVRGEDRRFVHSAGANALLSASDVPLERAKRAKVLYVGGYLLMPALDGEPLASLFREVRASGVTTVLDIVMPGSDDHLPKLESVLAETDVFLPNHDEAGALTGLHDPLRQAERFAQFGARTVVVTCGKAGSVLVSGETRLRVGAHEVEFAGGTGAGDAFDAGFIAGLLAGEDMVGALRWGSAVGASCVRSISATEGVFDRRQAEKFLREHPLEVESL